MEAEHKSVDKLIKQLKEEFGIQVSLVERSAALTHIAVASMALVIKFYSSLHFDVKHREEPLAGIRQIHLDEDLFLSKNKVIMARLRAALGLAKRVYARDTVLTRINKEEALRFQEEHHLQVPLPGKYRYGLWHEGTLTAVAVFSGGRKMRATASDYRSFELLRFCNRSGYLVVGGLSKLLKGFAREFTPGDIMTYVDKDWSSGENYEKLGFQSEGISPPQCFLVHAIEKKRYQDKRFDLPVDKGASAHHVENLGSIKMRQVL
ncbi:hypothetical protein [Olivibacter sp. XZL3]|uniref:hypothetical protein n=1 Tax=Olivibacter sp. XZL3 TaxID=1735116 RepID=UPI001066BEC5|nr:hypothetical protein [Olivibacter sp. XZL3]